MRTSIAGIFAAMAVLTGCGKASSDDLLPIRFSSMTTTKALVTDVSGMQSGLSLYGFETEPNGQETAIFDKAVLSYQSKSSEWSYGKTRYWIPDNSYTFIGLYPKDDASKYTNSGKTISFSHTISSYSYGGQQDLLAGCHYRGFTRGGDASDVVLPMRHILAAVEFKIQNACPGGTLDISEISLTGVYTAGSCTITPIPGESDYTVAWSPTGERLTSTTHYAGHNITGLKTGSSNVQDAFQEKILVIPQDTDVEDIKFSMRVDPSTISGTSDAYDKILSIADATNITAWEPGKKYTYIASVSSERITFQLIVNDWIEDEEYLLK